MADFSSRDYVNALARRLQSKYTSSQQAASAVSASALSRPYYSAVTGDSDYTKPSWLEANTDPQSGLGRVIDVISRPLYAVGEFTKQARDVAEYQVSGETQNPHVERLFENDNPLSKANAFFNMTTGALASGLAGRSKTLPSEVALKDWDTGEGFHGGRLAAGLGIDIALDPLTYVPLVGAGAAIAKMGGRGALRAQSALARGADDVVEAAEDIATSIPEPLQITAGGSGRHFSVDTAGEAVEKGTWFPNSNARNAAFAEMSSGSPIVSQRSWDTFLKSTTGETKPYRPGLLNLQRSTKAYPDLDIEVPFRKIESKPTKPKADLTIDDSVEIMRGVVATRARPKEPMSRWAKRNSEVRVRAATADRPAVTIGDLLEKAGNLRKDSTEKRLLAGLFEKAKNSESGGAPVTSTVAKAAPGASARAVAGAEGGTVGWGKLRGKALKDWHDNYTRVLTEQYPGKSLLIDEDLAALRAAKTKEEADAVIQSMRARTTRSPIYSTVYLPTEIRNITTRPERIARYVDDIPGPAERIPQITGKEVFDPPPVSGLDPDVQQVIRHAAGDMQQWAGRRADFKWDTGKTRAATNTPSMRSKGSLAVHLDSWNLMSQMNAHRAFVKRALQQPGISELKGTKRLRAIKEYVMPRLKQVDDFMRSHGVEPALTQQSQGYPVSLYDILAAIDKTTIPMTGKRGKQLAAGNVGKSFLERRIWDGIGRSAQGKVKGYRGTVDTDDLQLAVQYILDSLFTGTVNGKRGAGPIAKSVEDALKADIDPAPIKNLVGRDKSVDAGLARAGKRGEGTREITTQSKKGEYNVSPAEAARVRNEVAEILLSETFIRNIWEAVSKNAAARGLRVGQETARLSEGAVRQVMNAINNPSSTLGDMVDAIKKAPNRIDDAAKDVNALPESIDGAKAQFAEDITRTVAPQEMKMLDAISDVEKLERRAAELINKGVKPSEVARRLNPARVKQGEDIHRAAAAEGMSKLEPKDILSPGDVTEAAQYTSVFRKFYPSDSKVYRFAHKAAERFIPHYGHATIHPAMVTSNTLGRLLMIPWLNNLNSLQRVVSAAGDEGVEIAKSAMKMVQSGRPREELPESMLAIYDEMSSMMNMLFETSSQSRSSLGAFMRNGFDFDHINEAIARAASRANRSGNMYSRDISDFAQFDIEAAARVAKETGQDVYEVLGNQWRTWDIDDPLNFLAQMRHAMHIVSVESGTVQEALRIARAKNFVSKTKRPDFVKVSWPEEGTTFGRYFPDDVYLHKDIVSEFLQMDKIMQESRVMTSDFGRWVSGNFLPAQNIWKSGMTILRPGHHMRNLVGDLSLVGVSEGFRALKPAYTKRAIRMMGMRGRYDGWDYLKALQGEEFSLAGKATGRLNPIANDEVVVTTVVNGKKVEITAEQLHTGLLKGGVFPEFKHLEDLLDSYGGTKIADAEKKFQQSKAVNFAGTLSEARDDYVRIMHAMVFLENKTHRHKFKTLDEALEAAASQVRKWHPDGSDLTAFESKYMRTLFPFYSWTRKAVPLVIESMLMNPARVMVYPKATYHIAEANGIDLQTFADPFPTDQLFPSFLLDQPTGPMYMDNEGNYFGANPGIATMDVLRETLSDPWQKGVLGNLTPGIKAPIELMTRKSLSTGAEIHDPLEFVDSQLPLVTSVAGTTGYSVTGSIASLLAGQGLDEQRAVTKGNKDTFDRNAFLNYLFGAGIIDMSKESYINIAEIEKRDKAARELRKIRGE